MSSACTDLGCRQESSESCFHVSNFHPDVCKNATRSKTKILRNNTDSGRSKRGDSQGSQHVTWANHVHSHARMCPFNRQATSQMSHSSLCRVVWCLRLRNVDNGTRHASNHDHGPLGLSIHQVLGGLTCPEVCPIDIHTPELAHPIGRVCNGIKVLGEASRGDKMVDFAMIAENLLEARFYRLRIGYITEVGSHFRMAIAKEIRQYDIFPTESKLDDDDISTAKRVQSSIDHLERLCNRRTKAKLHLQFRTGILFFEVLHQEISLTLPFILYIDPISNCSSTQMVLDASTYCLDPQWRHPHHSAYMLGS